MLQGAVKNILGNVQIVRKIKVSLGGWRKMGGENTSSEQESSFWGLRKEFWKERFSYLNKYKHILGRGKLLPKWTNANVEEFI